MAVLSPIYHNVLGFALGVLSTAERFKIADAFALAISAEILFYIFAFVKRSGTMKAPVGLLSDRTVLRQQDGGASPRQVRVCRALRSAPNAFSREGVVKANGMLLLSAYRRRAADSAQAYPHGLSHKRLKIGAAQKILSLCTGSSSFPIIVTHPSKVNRPPCPAAAPPPAGPAAHGCRKRSAHCSRFVPPRCRAAPSAPAPGQRPHPAP